jgi:hypothetical protein
MFAMRGRGVVRALLVVMMAELYIAVDNGLSRRRSRSTSCGGVRYSCCSAALMAGWQHRLGRPTSPRAVDERVASNAESSNRRHRSPPSSLMASDMMYINLLTAMVENRKLSPDRKPLALVKQSSPISGRCHRRSCRRSSPCPVSADVQVCDGLPGRPPWVRGKRAPGAGMRILSREWWDGERAN